MNLLEEIRSQPPMVRRIMYGLSVATTLGILGFFWISSAEHDMFFALHTDPVEREQFVAQQEEHTPAPLAFIGKAFGTLVASIGSLIGFDSSKGFDNTPKADHTDAAPHPLPLSQ